eukprot:Hpha_TRINITY_DN15613_c0_g2::TRINITY_DN15613_c0_g2_i4::g.100098::m.100098
MPSFDQERTPLQEGVDAPAYQGMKDAVQVPVKQASWKYTESASAEQTGNAVLSVAILVVLGALEGFLLERSHVPAPEVIYDQMIFRRFAVMKMFFSALGASMLAQIVYRAYKPEEFEKSRFYKYKVSGYVRVVVGCALLGIGMTLCGTGPSMLPATFFVAESAWRILAGCFLGGITFALLDSFVFPLKARKELATDDDATVLENVAGGSYSKWAAVFGTVLVLCSIALEVIFPFDGCSGQFRCNEPIPTVRNAWPPTLAGLVIGLNQIPLRMITGDGQGGSTWYMNVISTLSFGKLSSVEGMEMTKLKNCYQAIFAVVGVTAGAVLSGGVYDELFEFPNFHWGRDVAGGFLIIFGSRMASGCTCGHGISGSSELSLESLAGTCAIFGGGIATGMIIEYGILGHPSAL